LVDEHGLCADRTTFYSKAQKALASSIINRSSFHQPFESIFHAVRLQHP